MAKKSTILYLITQSEWGGAQRYIFDLATSRLSQDYTVEVAAGGKGVLLQKLTEKGVSTHPLSHLQRSIHPWQDTMALIELIRLIKKIKPEVLHLNSSKAGILGSIAGKLCGVKRVVYTAHGFVFNEPLPYWQTAFYRVAETITSPLKNTIICMSTRDYQSALDKHITNKSRLAVVYNGIDPQPLKSKSEARGILNIPEDTFVIGTIANFYATKGLPYLIEATALLKKTYPKVLTVIIGFGEGEQELKKMITQLGVEKNVVLATNHPIDGATLLSAFNVFALPSLKEGFPYALLEASHAALPIVATHVGGNGDIIEHEKTGLLVPPAHAAALAEALEKIISFPEVAHRLGMSAKEKAAATWTLEKLVTDTEAIYKK